MCQGLAGRELISRAAALLFKMAGFPQKIVRCAETGKKGPYMAEVVVIGGESMETSLVESEILNSLDKILNKLLEICSKY